MSESPSRRTFSTLGRLAAEFLVIVVGVLTALAADAWWQEREDDARYRSAVTALIADVDENIAGLLDQRARMSDRIDAQLGAIHLVRSSESHSLEERRRVLLTLWQNPEFLILDGSLDAMRETEIWSRLPREARTLLSRIPKLAVLDPVDAVALETTTVQLSELIQEYGGWQGLLPTDLRDDVDLQVRYQDGDLDGLLRDGRFEHLQLGSLFLTANSRARLSAVVAELEDLRALLEGELE